MGKIEVLKREREAGVNLILGKVTLTEYLHYWLNEVIKPGRRHHTEKSYRATLERYAIPQIDQHKLCDLTPQHVQRMVNELAALKLRRVPGYTRSVLSRALNRAMKLGYIHRNEASLVDTPTAEGSTMTILSTQQVNQFLAAVVGHRLEAAYRLALQLGIRKGELLALRLEDIDLVAGTLHICGQLQWIDGKLLRVPVKTRKALRTLPLTPSLIAVLRRHLMRLEAEQLQDGWVEHGLLFPAELGTPLNGFNLIRHFKTVLHHTGLPMATRFHDLRHTAISLMLSQGVDARTVAELAGHSTITLTLDVYAHSTNATCRAAVAALDGLIGSTMAPQRAGGEENPGPSAQRAVAIPCPEARSRI